ncbi:MAG: ABC transporter ATP-binding protein [Oscillatoriales cyanobacterium SM2_2_1]|nr:ABC transporter ATP-binding protein [Oscillatoriales cyanobacterium SM2_2_1]
MSQPIITVENLGKSYLIRHQQRDRYLSLRDELVKAVRTSWYGLRYPDKRQRQTTHEEFWALKNISFDIKAGERIGVVGRNGAGKSTLLKILSRITEPSLGRIGIRGRVASLLEVGTGFHPELTGRENIFLNGAILGMERSEILRKFSEIVEFSEVEKFLDTPVKHYSSGMYVRLAFAVAAHLEPEILIVDEVLAVGDASFQKKCIGKMRDVASGEGRTILFVSHNMTAISALCPRSIYLKNGQILLDSRTADVVTYYQTENCSQISSQVDLTNAKRTGSGKVQFTSVTIKPVDVQKDGELTLYSGEDIEITVSLLSKIDIAGVNIALIIYDYSGYRLIDVNNALKGFFIEFKESKRKDIVFKLISPLLKSGSYLLGLWAGKGGTETIDQVEYACSFTINKRHNETVHVEEFPGTYCCEFLVKESS